MERLGDGVIRRAGVGLQKHMGARERACRGDAFLGHGQEGVTFGIGQGNHVFFRHDDLLVRR